MARWSQLPPDLLLLIAQRLNTRFDLLRLRSVCSSWHASVPSRLQPSCFVILPTNGTYGSLYLSRRTILCLRLPESHCQSTNCAWLIKVEEDVPGMAHLVNPLSTSQFKHLPPNFPKTVDFSRFRVFELGQEYVLQYMNHRPSGEADDWILRKKKVTCSPASNGEDFAMLTIHESGKLAMFRPGDQRLTIIDDMPSRCDDLIYFNGEFYAVDNTGRTVVVSTGSPPVLSLIADSVSGGDKKSLVESNGELLMVDAYFFPGIRGLLKMAARFKVFKLDQTEHMWVEVESLGDQILFLGEKSTFSAAASEFCGCEGNCIYHTLTLFIRNGHRDDANTTIGIFNIENGNMGPLSSFPDYSKVIWPPPAWVYTDDIGDEKKMEKGLMAAGGKASQRKEIRPWRQKGVNSSSSLLEALAQVNGASNNVVSHLGEDGVLRMKIVVKKQDLKKMLEVMRAGKSSAHQPLFSPQSSSLEQRLNLLRRKHIIRDNQCNRSRSCRSSWRPALHSIPEEL